VVGDGKLTFEGADVTWEGLDKRLQKVGDRAHTVLELAVSSENVSLRELNQARSRAEQRSKNFGFEYLSYIGVQSASSKGSPPAPRLADLDSPARQVLAGETMDGNLARISELQQLLVLLKSSENELAIKSQLFRDRIIPESNFKQAWELVDFLKAEIRRKIPSVARVHAHTLLSQAEDDFRRNSQLFHDHVISENQYNLAKEKVEVLRAEMNGADPARSRLASAELGLKQAKEDFRRQSELLQQHIIPLSSYEAAKQKVDSLEMEVERLKGSLLDSEPLERLKAQLRFAERGLESLSSRYKDGVITEEDYQRAKHAVDVLREEVRKGEPAR
jgi:multidrug resistance efflux pump